MSTQLHTNVIDLHQLSRPLADAMPSTLVIFAQKGMVVSPFVRELLGSAYERLLIAAEALSFKAKAFSVLDWPAPPLERWNRVLVIGLPSQPSAPTPTNAFDMAKLGGAVMGKLAAVSQATILFDLPYPLSDKTRAAHDFIMGLKLRAYQFDQYKTKKAEDDQPLEHVLHAHVALEDPVSVRLVLPEIDSVVGGVNLAREVVNLPPNVLNPAEFARRAQELESMGVEVEILDRAALEKLGMGALLAVGQGSANESKVAVLRWHGGGATQAPLAFVGKGVCFDSGGISIKPAASMEDMKGDMGGAACVLGLFHTLAARRAKIEAVGLLGLVENMPSGSAYRPGDILRAYSGQTIEVINTDAEGRLVLADLIAYAQERFKPELIIDLATLTGAVIVALGQEHAGLFTNNDELAIRLTESGIHTQEKIWRMPLGETYDQLIDSKFADMRNTGAKPMAGSITAAQFLKRFVKEGTVWAHLDVAGTAMSAPQTEINQSWGSGWGVRLLNHFVATHYEK